MPVSVEQLRPHLQAFDFQRLFVEGLGWNHYRAGPLTVRVDDREYSLRPVTEKAGFVVYECDSGGGDDIPRYPVRRKIESQIARLAFEHLIVFTDPGRRAQVWQWVKRESGKPAACREQEFHAGQSGEPILQRLLTVAFTLDDEARGIGISDVTPRIRKAFDVEKVTKRFYERFRTELTAFGNFIEGITTQGDRDWYASLMLNRMMFVYFVQKQGFLDANPDYLRNRLEMVQRLPAHPEPVEGPDPAVGAVREPPAPTAHPEPVEGPDPTSAHPEPVEGPDPIPAHPEPVEGPEPIPAHPERVEGPDPTSAHPEPVEGPEPIPAHPEPVEGPDPTSAHPEPVEGPGRFQRFYRLFLLRLFHEGLGQPEAQRAPDLAALLGKVPFLNGGLFDPHDLEKDNPDISIPDAAFERVFDFFDEYSWYLDERPGHKDNEINPDVLGYIFEKYVNQKQMGAYYTREDITGYISRNTIIPFLFDAARKECPVAFGPDGGVWRLLRDDPDRYIYPAVGHGIAWNARDPQNPIRLAHPAHPEPIEGPDPAVGAVREPPTPTAHPEPVEGPTPTAHPEPVEGHALPHHIAAGIDDVSKRGDWNRPAPGEYALPTETWREVVARRARYHEVRAKLASGEVREINDLITLNLDVERFAGDVIAQSEGPELLRAFWRALYGNRDRSDTGVSVLDPTCGSGAFLFAALNILEPLYTACLQGMRGFLDDAERSGRKRSPEHLGDFRRILEQVEKHPSERYFILKSIVLNNLYGVDIMEEAVEICKLRLFLKLVAQLERYDQIEPLPDIDFNVRAGNTLVGFTSLDAVRSAMHSVREQGADQGRMVMFEEEKEAIRRIQENAEIASRAFDRFREQQTALGGEITAAHKIDLRRRLDSLRSELDRYLAAEYEIAPNDQSAYRLWRTTHQPFHWFVEFYGIMSRGGFDVVIGNPPYVSRRKMAQSYTPKGLQTEGCPDIYATVVERSVDVCRSNGRTSMIVPLSLGFSSGFARLRSYLYDNCDALWFSSFGRIPSALFSFDTRVRNTIYLAHKSSKSPKRSFTTRLHRWFDSQRPVLFDSLSYAPFSPSAFGGLIPKLGSSRLLQGFESLLEDSSYRLQNELTPARQGHHLHFKQTAYNWLTFCIDQPPVYGSDDRLLPQTKYGTVLFRDASNRDLSMLLTNGKLLFVWWAAIGDDFDVTQSGFASAPVGPGQLTKRQRNRLMALLPDLEGAMNDNVVFKMNAGKNIGNYNLARCRHVTDKSDRVWLEALGLSDLWEDIELEHSLVVRTSYGAEEDA